MANLFRRIANCTAFYLSLSLVVTMGFLQLIVVFAGFSNYRPNRLWLQTAFTFLWTIFSWIAVCEVHERQIKRDKHCKGLYFHRCRKVLFQKNNLNVRVGRRGQHHNNRTGCDKMSECGKCSFFMVVLLDIIAAVLVMLCITNYYSWFDEQAPNSQGSLHQESQSALKSIQTAQLTILVIVLVIDILLRQLDNLIALLIFVMIWPVLLNNKKRQQCCGNIQYDSEEDFDNQVVADNQVRPMPNGSNNRQDQDSPAAMINHSSGENQQNGEGLDPFDVAGLGNSDLRQINFSPKIVIAQCQRLMTPMTLDMAEQVRECTICLEKLELDSQVVPLQCNKTHIFHAKCLLDWTKHSYTCPCCRQPMISDSEEIHRYLQYQRRNTSNILEDPLQFAQL